MNGTCVHESTCGCYDENGEEYPEGRFSIEGDECVEHECVNGELEEFSTTDYCLTFCGPGLEYDPDTPNPLNPCCGSCVTTSEPGATCTMKTQQTTLSAVDGSGTVCNTPTEVSISYCSGSCDNSGAEYFGDIKLNGDEVVASASTCACCTGTGYYEDVIFQCGFDEITFQVKMVDSCACNTCGGETAEEGEEEAAEAVEEAGSTLFASEDSDTSFAGLFGF